MKVTPASATAAVSPARNRMAEAQLDDHTLVTNDRDHPLTVEQVAVGSQSTETSASVALSLSQAGDLAALVSLNAQMAVSLRQIVLLFSAIASCDVEDDAVQGDLLPR